MITVCMADNGTTATIHICDLLPDGPAAQTRCQKDAEDIYNMLAESLPQATRYQLALLFARRDHMIPQRDQPDELIACLDLAIRYLENAEVQALPFALPSQAIATRCRLALMSAQK